MFLCIVKNGGSETIADEDQMSDVNDKLKAQGDESNEQQHAAPKIVDADVPMTFVETENDSLEHHKQNDDNETKEVDPPVENEIINTVRLVGEPLAAHGPYTFYSELAYRKRDDVTKKERRRWKKSMTAGDDESDNAAEAYNSSSSCCCANNDVCSCDDGSLSSNSSSHSEWSVVHMNHFYAVRPWYSKKNSSNSDQQQLRQQRRHRKNSTKLTKSNTAAAERQQHHYQQSVYIGELELLWRDDSMLTTSIDVSSSSQLKKRNGNRLVPSTLLTAASNGGGTNTMKNISNIHGGDVASSDEDDGVGGGFDDDSTTLLPRRRTLPRRTRQPSAKKLEAAESYAAASNNQLSSQSPYSRNRISTPALTDTTPVSVQLLSPDAHYSHGNILCSVRLYVMPDQTAAGRLGGVHGEDEVLEINTWNANGGAERWPSNVFINGNSVVGSIYNGSGSVDDYGYGSGSHSSGTLPSGCSGLVLRAEDFVEWVRGGLMNDDDENEDTESDNSSSELDCDDSFIDQKSNIIETKKPMDEIQSELSSLVTDVKGDVKQYQQDTLKAWSGDDNSIVKLELSLTKDMVKEENVLSTNPEIVKREKEELTVGADLGGDVNETIKQKPIDSDSYFYLKSAVEEAVETEHVPLAAARIHKQLNEHVTSHHRHHCRRQRHRLNHKSLDNGDGGQSNTAVTKKQDRRQYKVSALVNKGIMPIHLIKYRFYCFSIFFFFYS